MTDLLDSAESDEKRTVLGILTSKVGPDDLPVLDESMRQNLETSLSDVPSSLMTGEARDLLTALDTADGPIHEEGREGEGEQEEPQTRDLTGSGGAESSDVSRGESGRGDIEDLSKLMVLDEFREHIEDLDLHGTVAIQCFDEQRSGLFVSQAVYARLLEPVDVMVLRSGNDPCLDELMGLPRIRRFIAGEVLRTPDSSPDTIDELVTAIETGIENGARTVFASFPEKDLESVPDRVDSSRGDIFLISKEASGADGGVDVSVVLSEGEEAGQITAVVTQRAGETSSSVRYRYGLVDDLYKPIGHGVPEDAELCAGCGSHVPEAPEGADTVMCEKCARKKLASGGDEQTRRGLLGGGTRDVEDSGNRLI